MAESRGLSLAGDVAIITGAGQGIGEATARLFAERDASVVVADINVENASDVAEDIRAKGFIAVSCELDVTDGEQLDELISYTADRFGQLNHVVSNAGVAIDGRLVAQTDEEFATTIAINLMGSASLARRAIGFMIQNGDGGTISFASSTTAEFGLFGQTAYGASKGGIETLTKALSREVGGKGIRVNAVAPGPVETPMLAQVPDEGRDAMRSILALGRFAEPIEIARAYGWLASDEASFVTGAVIKVDGGFKKG